MKIPFKVMENYLNFASENECEPDTFALQCLEDRWVFLTRGRRHFHKSLLEINKASTSLSIYLLPTFVLHLLCCFPRDLDGRLLTWAGRWKPATLTGASGCRWVLWTYTWNTERRCQEATRFPCFSQERQRDVRPSTFFSGSFLRCPAPTCSCSSW